jgi:hypothetical protein
MDGSFACPECGSVVEIAGLAPGRQVRCGFCHRLLEVPYLPRVPLGTRRRRFGPSKWVRWAWWAVGVVAAIAVIVAGMRYIGRQYRSAQEGSINKLLASSRANEAAGQLGLALIDLDAALELTRRSGRSAHFPLDDERHRRADLARREARGTLEQLARNPSRSFPLGDWLNLIARTTKDPDLATLGPAVLAEFRRNLQHQIATELESGRRDFDAGRVVPSIEACERIAKLLPHLPPDAQAEVRRETEALVFRLIETHGVALETTQGHFEFGTLETYRGKLLAMLTRGLENKGYLPYRESSPWKSAWQKSRYNLRLEVSERLFGNYFSSQNRLTRIEAHLILRSPQKVVWETRPTAQTKTPLPGLTAFDSSRLAVNPARLEEFERRLYENARGQIDEKFGQALSFMPACCQ